MSRTLARSVDGLAVYGQALPRRQVYGPTDLIGKMPYSLLAIFANFQVNLLHARTKENMSDTHAKGRLGGRAPKLSAKRQRALMRMYDTGEYTTTNVCTVPAPPLTARCNGTKPQPQPDN